MRALVTGGTGFIGRHLVKALLEAGWSVVCLTRRRMVPAEPNIACITADLSVPQSLNLPPADMGRIDAIFHLAAQLPAPSGKIDPELYSQTNALGTAGLLKTFFQLQATVFVYMSSLPIIGKPRKLPITETHESRAEHPYLASKLAGEQLCEDIRRNHDRKIVSLRLTSPYGPGMPEHSVLPLFVDAALSSRDICFHGSGQRTQNFVHVSDAVRACLLAATSHAAGIYNIGGSSSISMRELAAMIVALIPGCRSRVIPSGRPDPQEDYRWDVNLDLSAKTLGYAPQIVLAAGISDYIDFLSSGKKPYQWWLDA